MMLTKINIQPACYPLFLHVLQVIWMKINVDTHPPETGECRCQRRFHA